MGKSKLSPWLQAVVKLEKLSNKFVREAARVCLEVPGNDRWRAYRAVFVGNLEDRVEAELTDVEEAATEVAIDAE